MNGEDTIRANIANVAGNATETALSKAIDASNVAALPFVGNNLKNTAKAVASKVARNVNDGIRRAGNNGTSNSSNNASGMGEMKPPSPPNGGNNDGSASRQFDNVRSNGAYHPMGRLATDPEPYTFELNTGIRAPVYAPLYQNSSLNGNISMRLAAFGIAFTSDAFQVSSFVQTVITTVFYNAIQRAVSFSIGTTITSSSLINWMNSLIPALNAYFWVKSILAYTSTPGNKNDAMISLRSTISASDLNYLYELERLLLGIPIPPNLVNYLWWMNGNYVDGQLPNSTICKMLTNTSSTLSYSTSTNLLSNTINWSTLISSLQTNAPVSVLVARAVPDWVKGVLPQYPSAPVYDSNWLTVFANIPVYCKNLSQTTALNLPYINSPTTSWSYNSYTNTLDGAALAVSTVYDVTNSKWLPNIASVGSISDSANAGQYTNRLVYFSNGWYDANYNNNGNITSLFTYFTGISNTEWSIGYPPGSQIVLGVNESSVAQSSMQLAEWLFSMDSVGYTKDNRVYDSKYLDAIGFPPNKNQSKMNNNRRKRK